MTASKHLLWLLLPLAVGARAAEFWDTRSLQLIQTTQANYPGGLLLEGVREGQARAVLWVDAEGKLLDCLITGYTHAPFGVELLAHLRGCEFRPAYARGEPIATRVEATFNFEARGQVISLTMNDAMSAATFGLANSPLISLLCPLAELDQVPTPVHVVQPLHPGRLLQPSQPEGTASVDFYIDGEGRPRMPVVTRASHELFGAAAVAAIEQWRYSPPTRRGRPVIVRAVQQFKFSDSAPMGGTGAAVAFARKSGSTGVSSR